MLFVTIVCEILISTYLIRKLIAFLLIAKFINCNKLNIVSNYILCIKLIHTFYVPLKRS